MSLSVFTAMSVLKDTTLFILAVFLGRYVWEVNAVTSDDRAWDCVPGGLQGHLSCPGHV